MASTSYFIFLFHFNVLSFLYFGQLGLFAGTHTRLISWLLFKNRSSPPPLPLPLFNHEREISSSTGQRRRVYNYRLSLLSEVTRLLLFSFHNVWLSYTYGLFTCQKARSSSRSRKENGGTFKPIELSWHTPSAPCARLSFILPRHVAMTATPILSGCRCVVLPIRIDSHNTR